VTSLAARPGVPAPDGSHAGPRAVVAISSGHSPVSSTQRLAALIADAAAARLVAGGLPARTDHVVVRDSAAEVVATLVDGLVRPGVARAVATVQRADALVIVTPTINASISGLLKAFLDVLPPDALRSVPTVIAATGGTSRHTLMLDQVMRPMLGFQRAIVMPCCLYVTADEWDGARPGPRLAERIETAAGELAAFTAITQH